MDGDVTQAGDYWTEAVVFTTSNNSFGPMEISYLEKRFANMSDAAKRYIVKNNNEPTLGNITEEKESELEEFIDYAKVVMGIFGHKVFEQTADGFVALKGKFRQEWDFTRGRSIQEPLIR